MTYLKLICCVVCLSITASHFNLMSHWSERRGVSDDLCYLRQAYLFQKFGLDGIRTDIAIDTEDHFKTLVTEAGQPGWHTPDSTICHVRMAKTGLLVLQYPPGVGAVLALFRAGHQVVPVYMVATLLVLAMAVLAIALARSRAAILGAAVFGWAALYFMVNPAKASYSIPPTLVICTIAGFLTAKLFDLEKRGWRWLVAATIGLLLGASVNFRIPNLLLLAGYGLFFLAAFAARRRLDTFVQGALFGISSVIGLMPTLIANAVNAGSPVSTTYGGPDLALPDLTFSITRSYLGDLQGALVLAASAWAIALFSRQRTRWLWPLAAIVTINLAVNLGYFLSHPIFTQYYLMPIAMLSLWSLLFGYVLDDRRRSAVAAMADGVTSPATPACASRQMP